MKSQSSVSISTEAENLHSDKDYTTSTLEKQVEFDKKRNYTYTQDTELEEYRKQAMEMWNDSCTSPRKPNETA